MKVLVAFAVMLVPAPLLAQSNSAPAAQPGEQAKQDGERRICREVRMNSSSSRIRPQRLCLTRLEWRHRDDISTDDAADTFDVRSRQIEVPNTRPTPQ